jgi:hypothetical protein
MLTAAMIIALVSAWQAISIALSESALSESGQSRKRRKKRAPKR